eukprot:TRINITY_DN9481_c0_g2_i1.p1 TRINITY_DN9481_c0_g2~~TRINITY_DN9481_c0_g2_i1.p1  ORF type:complete len:804 (-),score=171.68 TRINITY_DN9481_c0_g2_i1:129-2540(-)
MRALGRRLGCTCFPRARKDTPATELINTSRLSLDELLDEVDNLDEQAANSLPRLLKRQAAGAASEKQPFHEEKRRPPSPGEAAKDSEVSEAVSGEEAEDSEATSSYDDEEAAPWLLEAIAAARGHYDVLGIKRTATAAEVSTAYRKRARLTHPDKGGDPTDFHKVSAAYEELGDAGRRAAYDRALVASNGMDGMDSQGQYLNADALRAHQAATAAAAGQQQHQQHQQQHQQQSRQQPQQQQQTHRATGAAAGGGRAKRGVAFRSLDSEIEISADGEARYWRTSYNDARDPQFMPFRREPGLRVEDDEEVDDPYTIKYNFADIAAPTWNHGNRPPPTAPPPAPAARPPAPAPRPAPAPAPAPVPAPPPEAAPPPPAASGRPYYNFWGPDDGAADIIHQRYEPPAPAAPAANYAPAPSAASAAADYDRGRISFAPPAAPVAQNPNDYGRMMGFAGPSPAPAHQNPDDYGCILGFVPSAAAQASPLAGAFSARAPPQGTPPAYGNPPGASGNGAGNGWAPYRDTSGGVAHAAGRGAPGPAAMAPPPPLAAGAVSSRLLPKSPEVINMGAFHARHAPAGPLQSDSDASTLLLPSGVEGRRAQRSCWQTYATSTFGSMLDFHRAPAAAMRADGSGEAAPPADIGGHVVAPEADAGKEEAETSSSEIFEDKEWAAKRFARCQRRKCGDDGYIRDQDDLPPRVGARLSEEEAAPCALGIGWHGVQDKVKRKLLGPATRPQLPTYRRGHGAVEEPPEDAGSEATEVVGVAAAAMARWRRGEDRWQHAPARRREEEPPARSRTRRTDLKARR